MSCISRLQAKLKKNVHAQGIKEPNKLKNEAYRLTFERDKVKEAEAEIAKILNDMARLEAERQNSEADVVRHKEGELKRRGQLEAKIEQQEGLIVKKRSQVEEKKKELEALLRDNEGNLSILKQKNESSPGSHRSAGKKGRRREADPGDHREDLQPDQQEQRRDGVPQD